MHNNVIHNLLYGNPSNKRATDTIFQPHGQSFEKGVHKGRVHNIILSVFGSQTSTAHLLRDVLDDRHRYFRMYRKMKATAMHANMEREIWVLKFPPN